MRRILCAGLALLGIAFGAAAAGLVWAHIAVRREAAPLPSVAAVAATAGAADPPVRLSYVNTASQEMPRAAVLDAGRDPHAGDPYVMSHPSFVLEWADGRMLLVDVGMTTEGAMAFGRPLALLGGAEPMQPHAAVADALGDAAPRVAGAVFTHLHTDHVGGIGALCARVGHPLTVPMTVAQAERPNYTTRPGLALLREAGCVRPVPLDGERLMPVPGFPGVSMIDAGGHTPGSQIITAVVRGSDGERRVAFSGDIVNNLDGILFDLPKPLLYRTLIVPESDARQAELRAFLKRLHDEAGFMLLVSHDQRSLEASGIPNYVTGDQ